MTTHYKLHVIAIKTDIKLTYRNGSFKRFELLKKGNLSATYMVHIGRIIPFKESDITRFVLEKKDKVVYTKVTKQPTSDYSDFSGAWFDFYERFMGFQPDFNGIQGASLKKIMAYLYKITEDHSEALELWQLILSSWGELDEFHRNNTCLKYIYGNINKILHNVKRNNEAASGGLDDDDLQSIVNGL